MYVGEQSNHGNHLKLYILMIKEIYCNPVDNYFNISQNKVK